MKVLKMLVFTTILLLPLTGCIPPAMLKKSSESGVKEPTILKSPDGQTQVTIPTGWKEDKTLHEEAVIQARDVASEVCVLVFTESKDDFDEMTVDKYSELIRSHTMEAIKSPQLSSPSRLTINGYPALQYEIRGSVDNVKLVYLQVAVESAQSFHQIVTWTTPSLFEKNRSQMESVIASFKETVPADQSK